jgi:pSer/pThr/pTyr-binding forkhead associated (FHA) protein
LPDPVQIRTTVTVQLPDGRELAQELEPGKSLLVGSSDGCGLPLRAEGVAEIHCLLWLNGGEVWLQDWYSSTGTFVDGQRVTETPVSTKSEIRVGPFRLQVHRAEAAAIDPPRRPSDDRARVTAASPVAQRLAADAPHREATPATPPAAKPDPEAERLRMQLEQSRRDLDQSQRELAGLREQLARQRRQAAARSPGGPEWQPDPHQAEMEELLRAEVTQLQQELAEKDARLKELSELIQQEGTSAIDLAGASAETATLVDRLEQLLDELQKKDEQQVALEEMLRAADDANRSEQEERRQLEAWVADIEERIGQRESEWQGTVQSLRRRIEELTAARDRAERALDEAASGDAPAAHDLVASLRERISETEQRLAQSEARCEEAERRLADAAHSPEQRGHAELPAREEQLALARERAELARQRAELEKERQWMQRATGPDEANERMRALRQHLNEIHAKQEDERQQRSLSARLSRLWRRLEGRPN